MAVRHIDSLDDVEMHRRFFADTSIDDMMQQYLRTAQELEPFLADQAKVPLGSEIRQHQEAWSEIKSYAPVHMKKVAFILDEQMLDKHLQAVESQLISESQSLQKGENVAKITAEHVKFFTENMLVEKIEACLDNLSNLAYECQTHEPTLQDSYDVYKSRWDAIRSRMENIFGQLEQIPEQWKAYEMKFREMSEWMNTVEKSLDKVFKGVTTHDGFLREKQNFQVPHTYYLCYPFDL